MSRRFFALPFLAVLAVLFLGLPSFAAEENELRVVRIVPKSATNVTIHWDGGRGLGRYQVQTSTNARDWANLYAPLEGVTQCVCPAYGSVRFFRVRLLPDVIAPTTPEDLVATSSNRAVILSWTPSSDTGGAGLWGYALMRNGAMQELVDGSVSRFTDLAVVPGQSYSYRLLSVDTAGNWSDESSPAVATVPLAQDRTAPSVPAGLVASAPSCSQVALSWSPSSDFSGSGVQGYRVYFGTGLVQQVMHPVTSFTHLGRLASRTYVYSVSAFDFAGNESARSAPAAVTTPVCPDVTPPTVTMISPAGGDSVSQLFTVAASASDNVRISRVEFYRDNGIHLNTFTGTNYNLSLDPRTMSVGMHGFYARAYDAAGNTGMSVTNFVLITNHAAAVHAPELMGFLPGIGAANGVEVVGNLAYVASGLWGLSIADVSNPASPRLISSVDVPFDGQHVAVSGSLACVSGRRVAYSRPGEKNGVDVFYVVDVSNPAAPVVRGQIENSESAFYGIAMHGDYAYVACGAKGVGVIDISNPTVPEMVASYDTPGWAFGVVVQGNYLFVADGSQGLRILNITNPLSPAALDPNNPAKGAIAASGNVWDIAVIGDHAYLAAANSFEVVNVANKLSPASVGSYAMSYPHTAVRVAMQNNHAYVATSAGGLVILDISEPAIPVKSSTLAPTGGSSAITLGVATAGSYAYLANGEGGLAVVNVSAPNNPAVTYSLRHWFDGRQVATRPGLAVVTGVQYAEGNRTTNGFRIFDTQNPAAPRLIGRIDNASETFLGVALSGNYAYIACGSAGVAVVDLTNPATPVWVGTRDTPGWAFGVAVQGAYLFVADGSQGLRIFDLANPRAPMPLDTKNSKIGAITVGANVRHVFVSGNYAYLSASSSFQVIDISNKRVPAVRGVRSLGFPYSVLQSVVQNGYAYVAGSGGGLAVIDVRNPISPVLAGSLAPSGSTSAITVNVAVLGNLALMANTTGGVNLVDVTNPANPQTFQSVATLGSASALNLVGNWLWVADSMSAVNSVLLR